ncbi:hypothetical protein [Ottowia caeni]|uniref:hypothetical protein n=1 Tax=Ottowia caeni TaxID=2870339 RepID=UPI003D706E4B
MIKRLGGDLSRQLGRGFGWRNLTQMRAFYLAWPTDQISHKLFAKSPALPILQTLPGESAPTLISETPSRNAIDLSTLDQHFSRTVASCEQEPSFFSVWHAGRCRVRFGRVRHRPPRPLAAVSRCRRRVTQ